MNFGIVAALLPIQPGLAIYAFHFPPQSRVGTGGAFANFTMFEGSAGNKQTTVIAGTKLARVSNDSLER